MRMTGILYKGDKKSVQELYKRYLERIKSEIEISIVGDNHKYLGKLIDIKMNDNNTILYGDVELYLDKYEDLKWNYLETRLKDEDFVRRFPIGGKR